MSTSNYKIDSVESTPDILTDRAGLAPFCNYLESSGVLNRLETQFSSLKKNSKGLQVKDFFKQVFSWLMDGTSRHISYFDDLKKDEGYAATLETNPEDMGSSFAITRMFEKFSKPHELGFRNILLDIFINRLKQEKPSVIELSVDSMVMNNDKADKRQGVSCTYKKVKGYHPMQIVWNGMIIDAIFRSGKKPTNEIKKTLSMLKRLIKRVRDELGDSVTMVIRLDGGYYDKRIMDYLNEENVAFIVSGKMYEFVKDAIETTNESEWKEYNNKKLIWRFTELGLRSSSWNNFYRALYTQLLNREDGQFVLDFARPANVILTNIGLNPKVLENMSESEQNYWITPEAILKSHHGRGADELPHRALKELGFEELPFQQFSQNMGVYQCMVLALALFEGYKRDVLHGIVSPTSYANTVRRKVIDLAGKIVRTARSIKLKLCEAVLDRISFKEIWLRSSSPQFSI